MIRFTTFAATAAMLVAVPGALADKPASSPGNSGNNPHGGAPGVASAPPTAPSQRGGSSASTPPSHSNAGGNGGGKPTAPPGNSGNNPHGGPPGITGDPPTKPEKAPKPAPTPGNPGGTPQGPDGKITICHATGSETNPYVEITISVNGLNGHGGHHDGADIVPAPAGGCPETVAGSDPAREQRGAAGPDRDPRGAVAGEQASGDDSLASAPLSEGDESATCDPASDSEGTLPFTGIDLIWLLLIGAGLVATGLLFRRWSRPMT